MAQGTRSLVDNARERWERMNPRERKLTAALAITFVVCIFAWLAFAARDGMAAIETKNDASRKALRALAQYRVGVAKQAEAGKGIDIPASAPSLDSYLEDIVNELSLESPTYPAPKATEKGGFTELSFTVQFKGLDIVQLTSLLEKIETKSKVVIVKELSVDRNFRDKEKLDVDIVVATFEKPKADEDEEDEDEG